MYVYNGALIQCNLHTAQKLTNAMSQLCTDIDECSEAARRETTICEESTRCVNTPGDFECVCFDGYSRVNGTCQSEL